MSWRVPVSHFRSVVLFHLVVLLSGCTETTSMPASPSWADGLVETSTRTGLVGSGPAVADAAQAATPGSAAAPLAPAPGWNITASVCSEAIKRKVQEFGALHFETASASSHNWTRDGTYFGRVRMRVVYPTVNGSETRDSVIVCVVDARGRLMDVYTPAD
jgi:hypothetical protein